MGRSLYSNIQTHHNEFVIWVTIQQITIQGTTISYQYSWMGNIQILLIITPIYHNSSLVYNLTIMIQSVAMNTLSHLTPQKHSKARMGSKGLSPQPPYFLWYIIHTLEFPQCSMWRISVTKLEASILLCDNILTRRILQTHSCCLTKFNEKAFRYFRISHDAISTGMPVTTMLACKTNE